MSNDISLISRLCGEAYTGIENLSLPHQFRNLALPSVPRDEKANFRILPAVRTHFSDNQFKIERKSTLKACITYTNTYGYHIKITITFFALCWRLEYMYVIEPGDGYLSGLHYFCNFEENSVDIDGAVENMRIITDYLKETVEEKYHQLKQNSK